MKTTFHLQTQMHSLGIAQTIILLLFMITITCAVNAQVNNPTAPTLTSDKTTALKLTLDGRVPEGNRIFGHNIPRTLGGGLPEGGEYSGRGVEDGKFIPSLAGNGTWTITYSKEGYAPSTTTIEVFGVSEDISNWVCNKCEGKQIEICPVCGGAKRKENRVCKRCKGNGTIPCQECMGNEEGINDSNYITDLVSLLSCCHLSHIVRGGWGGTSWRDRNDDFILVLGNRFGFFDEFNPVMYLYVLEAATGKLKRYSLPSMASERIECRKMKEDGSQISFTFNIEASDLIDSNIRIMEIAAKYGEYNVSFFFDLQDIANGEEYYDDDLRVKYILFDKKYYFLPVSVFIDESNDKLSKENSDRGWQIEEICSGWILQKNKKGEKRILDNDRKLRIESGDRRLTKAKDIDAFWDDIKCQLEDKNDFWEKWFKLSPPKEKDDSINLSEIFNLKNNNPNKEK